MTKLEWIERVRGTSSGYSGTVRVATIFDLRDAVPGVERGFKWELDGIVTRWLSITSHGTLKTLQGAQAAAQRAWDEWQKAAGMGEAA